jgi:hypothetical protein
VEIQEALNGNVICRRVEDLETIGRILEIANQRRTVSKTMDINLPASGITAIFYCKSEFLTAMGAGRDFLFVSCPNGRQIRSATEAEINEVRGNDRGQTGPIAPAGDRMHESV